MPMLDSKRGGKREGAGRKPGKYKVNKTFSIDIEIVDMLPKNKSELVNRLLKDHFNQKINTFTS